MYRTTVEEWREKERSACGQRVMGPDRSFNDSCVTMEVIKMH